jgi:hypothetical protein
VQYTKPFLKVVSSITFILYLKFPVNTTETFSVSLKHDGNNNVTSGTRQLLF